VGITSMVRFFAVIVVTYQRDHGDGVPQGPSAI
jgi:hypothetical protein